jgi:bifunctional UDP-N-acetylglucosamine pyrophosphorylase/glucosamine-1-phosphate N-acetyltransferase
MPVLLTTPLAQFPIGNLPLHQHPLPAGWHRHHHAWLSAADLHTLLGSSATTLIDAAGIPLAWKHSHPDAHTLCATTSFLILHSWDLLKANEDHIGNLQSSEIHGEVHPAAHIEGIVHIGKGTRILPGVFIEGNAIIGENCKIGPNCYIRGNTSIGDSCHIGQAVEVKNSLILSHTAIGHLSYVGDSVIGHKVNFGAGTITANFRHDGKTHRTMLDGQLIDTGRRKFGTIIGDHVHTGIHTAIYPGRKLHAHTHTLPAQIVTHDILL